MNGERLVHRRQRESAGFLGCSAYVRLPVDLALTPTVVDETASIETTVPARIPALNLNLWMLPTVSWTFFHGDDPKELLFVNQIDGGAGSQADAPA